MFQELWQDRQKLSGQETKSIKTEQNRIAIKMEQLIDRIVGEDDPSLIEIYENHARKLEKQRTALSEKVKNCRRPLNTFDDTSRTAFECLANPYETWNSDRLEDKRSVLRLVFSERLPYYRNGGCRTAAFSLPFCLLEGVKGVRIGVPSEI